MANGFIGRAAKYGYDKAGRLTKAEQYRLIDPALADVMQIELQVTSFERKRYTNTTSQAN